MSESDNTWNADDEPTQSPESPAAEVPANWPQYSWPPAAENVAPQPPAPATPDPDPTWVSWPPTQPNPTQPNPAQANPAQPNPAQADPTQPYPPVDAAGPYAAGPYSPGPYSGPWGPPPQWTTPGPAAWPPAAPTTIPPTSGPPARMRRAVALLAALALVLASAGVGAAVAIALHGNSNSRSFASAGTNTPSDNGTGTGNNNGNGFGGGNGFGNLGGNGSGTVPSGTGTLDQNAIAAKVDPALVDINTTLAQGRAAGTGMLISSDGEILTNNHVIADATSIKVVVNGGTGATYTAKVLGYDVTEDVALIKISDKVSNLPTVTFGDATKVAIGDAVVAIGNAGGRGGTPSVSQGHVTRIDQQVTAGDAGGAQETLEGMIQIDAPIEPGDSGGALVDASGHIIGMNTAAAGGGNFNQQASNIGFAIPEDHAITIVKQIQTGVDTDKVHIGDRALLGVQVEDLNGQAAPATSGALVQSVQSGTGADSAGIQAGDVITTINGKAVTNPDALRVALGPLHPGDSVTVGWVDSTGSSKSASVKLVVGPPL